MSQERQEVHLKKWNNWSQVDAREPTQQRRKGLNRRAGGTRLPRIRKGNRVKHKKCPESMSIRIDPQLYAIESHLSQILVGLNKGIL